VLSFGCGLISLSQEILWVRLVGFAYGNPPQVFAFVLGLYLLGIAAGAHLGKRFCRDGHDLYGVAGRVLLLSVACDALAPFLYVGAMKLDPTFGLVVLVPAVVLVALFKSIVFPIAHHLGSASAQQHVGASVSRVYFANILGSALGPLLTGFYLLERVTMQQAMFVMCAATAALAAFCFTVRGTLPRWAIAVAPLPLLTGVLLPPVLVPLLIARAWYPVAEQTEPGVIAAIRENRHGIVHLMSDGKGPDTMWGGNVYDGRVNTSLANDVNGIQRVYMLAALQPEARRVLEIGVSIGAWTKVLSGFPRLERLDAVELNPAYMELIARYPQVDSVLTDPRVAIHIDDGRRWLKRHPDTRFDLIVINTTFHWRAYASLLLSREFMQRLSAHLNAGGVLAFNTTGSIDAYATVASVFPHVYRLGNFVYASDRDLTPELAHLEARIAAVGWGGTPAADLSDPMVRETIRSMREGFESPAAFIAQAGRAPEIITEQNMLTEYRYGQRFW
jgi:spermidine synthase